MSEARLSRLAIRPKTPLATAPTFRPCAVIPTYDNLSAVAEVVRRVRRDLTDIIVVDDGGAQPSHDIVAGLARAGLAIAVHRPANGGKGAAVKTGLAEAQARGFSHALQIDGDGQHDLDQIPAFLEAARAQPTAVILASPVYGPTAPKSRLKARKITKFWVDVETGGAVIDDAMVGFRIYPVAATLACGAKGDRMEFDIEVAVRLAWAGVPVVNLPVAVRYLTAEEGGISHFRVVRDNVLISWLHTRLTTLAIFRWLLRPFRRFA